MLDEAVKVIFSLNYDLQIHESSAVCNKMAF
jgi:hypothetical protein